MVGIVPQSAAFPLLPAILASAAVHVLCPGLWSFPSITVEPTESTGTGCRWDPESERQVASVLPPRER